MMSFDFFLQTNDVVCTLDTLVKDLQETIRDKRPTHFPVVDLEGIWIGNISSEKLMKEDGEKKIKSLEIDLEKFYVLESSMLNPFDFFSLYTLCHTNVIPLLDDEGRVKGVYRKDDLLNEWSKASFIMENGTTFVIERNEQDYSFAEVSQIVESNNAKLIGILILSRKNSMTRLLVKTNSVSTKYILDDLRRYGYDIISSLSEDTHLSELRERNEYLTKYLNI